MRRRACLLTRSWPDTEHMSLLDAILLIGERGIQRAGRSNACCTG